jgi:hypothetical protein
LLWLPGGELSSLYFRDSLFIFNPTFSHHPSPGRLFSPYSPYFSLKASIHHTSSFYFSCLLPFIFSVDTPRSVKMADALGALLEASLDPRRNKEGEYMKS